MTAHAHGLLSFWPLTGLWFVMMAAMMTPTVWPWVRSFHRFGGDTARVPRTAQFASGYLAAWFAFAMGAALLQRAFVSLGALGRVDDAVSPAAGGLVLLAAGLYQFTPFKQAYLAHCRTPFGFFLAQWDDGPTGPIRLGLGHGVYCLGCCWALMLTAFAVGTMNVWWMLVLSAVAFVEQVVPGGQRLRVPLGVALVAVGAWLLAATAR